MANTPPKTPDVIVRERVEVVLSRHEVEHALRCWLSHHLVPNKAAPPARDFSRIEVNFEISGYDDDLPIMEAVTLIYEPAPRDATADTDGSVGMVAQAEVTKP